MPMISEWIGGSEESRYKREKEIIGGFYHRRCDKRDSVGKRWHDLKKEEKKV